MDPALGARWNLERQCLKKEGVMQVVRIGLDLAKYVFVVHGVDSHGKVAVRKTLLAGTDYVYPRTRWRCSLLREPRPNGGAANFGFLKQPSLDTPQ
jgi:hypothetical protein